MKSIQLTDEAAEKLAELLHDTFDGIRRSWRDNILNPGSEEDAAGEMEYMKVLEVAYVQIGSESLFDEFDIKPPSAAPAK